MVQRNTRRQAQRGYADLPYEPRCVRAGVFKYLRIDRSGCGGFRKGCETETRGCRCSRNIPERLGELLRMSDLQGDRRPRGVACRFHAVFREQDVRSAFEALPGYDGAYEHVPVFAQGCEDDAPRRQCHSLPLFDRVQFRPSVG